MPSLTVPYNHNTWRILDEGSHFVRRLYAEQSFLLACVGLVNMR